jgi:hypothetical protein
MAFGFLSLVKAQNNPLIEPQLMYSRSNTFSFNINSFKGWGLQYRLGWHKTGKQQNHWEVELARIKHPKEVKRQGFTDNPSQYAFGKLNTVFFLRNTFGQTVAITERPYKNALGFNFVYSLGVTTAMLKPQYIEVYYPYDNVSNSGYLVSERYDPNKHTDIYRIYGKSPFTKGISETQFQIGFGGRAGFQVEFGQYADEIKGLEAGVTFDGFLNGLPMMAKNNFDRLFYGFYLSYNWGNRK